MSRRVDVGPSFHSSDLDHKLDAAALNALHKAELVPEHIETRRLFNDSQPAIEQGAFAHPSHR